MNIWQLSDHTTALELWYQEFHFQAFWFYSNFSATTTIGFLISHQWKLWLECFSCVKDINLCCCRFDQVEFIKLKMGFSPPPWKMPIRTKAHQELSPSEQCPSGRKPIWHQSTFKSWFSYKKKVHRTFFQFMCIYKYLMGVFHLEIIGHCPIY